jgi:hypothetical protein
MRKSLRVDTLLGHTSCTLALKSRAFGELEAEVHYNIHVIPRGNYLIIGIGDKSRVLIPPSAPLRAMTWPTVIHG